MSTKMLVQFRTVILRSSREMSYFTFMVIEAESEVIGGSHILNIAKFAGENVHNVLSITIDMSALDMERTFGRTRTTFDNRFTIDKWTNLASRLIARYHHGSYICAAVEFTSHKKFSQIWWMSKRDNRNIWYSASHSFRSMNKGLIFTKNTGDVRKTGMIVNDKRSDFERRLGLRI